MKKVKLLISSMALLVVSLSANASHLADNLLVSARLNGMQEVPSVMTNAVGVASIMLNSTRDTLCVNISVTGLSGPITGIHIHEGAAGTNGSVLLNLSTFVSGNRIQARLTGADASAANVAKLLSGQLYVNVHTAANPGGEIRGQLSLESDWSFVADLSGAKEVPAVSTMAYGLGVFNLSKDESKIEYNVVVQNLSGAITGAHLHFGMANANGPVAENLTASVMGNTIIGVISSPSQALMDSIKAGNVYLNVHTMANAGGEIRSQLTNSAKHLYFDAQLNGAQEVPAVSTTAMGVGSLWLNATMDTMWYDIVADGLSGALTGAHIHEATAGNNGPVVHNMTTDINGNRITGTITGATLTDELINDFLSGALYFNLHTAANANGEIRGQIYRLAREGYVMSLDGMQEVPSVSTTASGSGMVSIDRNQSNAHYMIVIDGLTTTGAHFHNNVAGQNGGVIYNLTSSFMNNGAFGYWRSTDAVPFTTASSVQFRNDSVYVNIHTSANPNGEIRGQALRGFQCSENTIGLNEEVENSKELIKVYPNPASNVVNVLIDSEYTAEAELKVYNLIGSEVYSSSIELAKGQNEISLDIEEWSKGVYLIAIPNTTNTVQKFVKQ